jgi:O-antigen ligase
MTTVCEKKRFDFTAALRRFFYSDAYIVFVTLVGFLAWAFNLALPGIAVYVALIALCLLFLPETTPLLPPICMATFIFREEIVSSVGAAAYVIAPVLAVSVIVFFLRNKTRLKFGKYFWGMAVLPLGVLFSGLGAKTYSFENNIVIVLLLLFLLFVYVFFYSTLGGRFKEIAVKTFTAVSVLLVLEVVTIYVLKYAEGNLDDILEYKIIDFGWGVSNAIACVITMLIPITFYLSVKSKYYPFFIVLGFVEFLAVVGMLSRGNIIIAAVFLVFALVFCVIKSPRRKSYFIATECVVILALVFVYIFSRPIFFKLFEWLREASLSDRGRLELYGDAWNIFKENPIAGGGLFARVDENGPVFFHSTVLQILANFGLIGMVAFGVLFFQRYYTPLTHMSLFTFFVACAILCGAVYGLIDRTFFYPYNMIFNIFFALLIEKETGAVNTFAAVRAVFRRKPGAIG